MTYHSLQAGVAMILAAIAASAFAADGVATEAGPEGPAQVAYAPAKVPAPAIVVISGQSGVASYQKFASELADLGYYTVLVAGRDSLTPGPEGAANLRRALERTTQSDKALPGKAAVIGFSLGGGAALANAAGLADLVSAVVVYYPFTSFRVGPTWFVKNLRVPVLFLVAELDRYNNCCTIESARLIEAAAKQSGARFELVVYPHADHGFNLETGAKGEPGRAYRRDDDRDAWRRTVEMLKMHHPLR